MEPTDEVRAGRSRLALTLAFAATVPGVAIRVLHPELSHPLEAVLFGLAIVGAAFLLSWAAEVAQLDISAGLAIALLALIAVLPEYAVDFVFASKGGNSVQAYGPSCPPIGGGTESPCSLALANMTGANRLLIGIGWSMVIFIAWYRVRTMRRRAGRPPARWEGVRLDRSHSVELAYLAVATAYSLTLPLKHSITLIDSVVLVGIFVAYTWRISRAPAEEPHLVGPAAWLGTFSPRARHTDDRRPVRGGGRRHPALRRTLRRVAGRERRGRRHQRVPPRAVAGAARERGAGAAGRRACTRGA